MDTEMFLWDMIDMINSEEYDVDMLVVTMYSVLRQLGEELEVHDG